MSDTGLARLGAAPGEIVVVPRRMRDQLALSDAMALRGHGGLRHFAAVQL